MPTRLVAVLILCFVLTCAVASPQVPSNAEIRKILADRVGAENIGIGIVVGVIDANGRRVVAYGSLAKNDKRRLQRRHRLRDRLHDQSVHVPGAHGHGTPRRGRA